MARAGEVIGERYRLEREIGSGAMGSVWLAKHVSLDRAFAVKLVNFEAARRGESLARFRREALIAVKIQSDHVVEVIDHGEHNELPYIVMEYLEGESLRQRLDQRGRLALAETAKVLRHTARALAAAHALGLVHRDIKPENIFVTTVDDEELYKVLDFGVAKVTDELSRDGVDPTKTGALLGTPYYLSPEQAQGLKSLDHRADLWSLAVVAFECATGRRPFVGAGLGPLISQIMLADIPVPSDKAPDARLPPSIDEWMAKGLSRDPAGRFDSASEMAEAFAVASGIADSLDPNVSKPAAIAAGNAKSPSLASLERTVALPEGAGELSTATLPLGESELGDTVAFPEAAGGDSPAQRDPILEKTWPEAPERQRSWMPIALVVLVVALLAGVGAYFLLRARSPSPAGDGSTRGHIFSISAQLSPSIRHIRIGSSWGLTCQTVRPGLPGKAGSRR